MSDVNTPVVTPEAGEPKAEKSGPPDYLKMMSKEIQDAVNAIKAQGITVFMTFLGDRAYLFRTLNVIEWMKIQKAQEERAQAKGATPEYLEQALFENIVLNTNLGVIITEDLGKEKLLPAITRDTIKAQPAGVPSSLAQQVMYQSGFDQNPMTVKL